MYIVVDDIGELRRLPGWNCLHTIKKPLPDCDSLRQHELELTHVTATHRFGKPRHTCQTDSGFLRKFADAGAGRSGQIVENRFGDFLLCKPQLSATLGNA